MCAGSAGCVRALPAQKNRCAATLFWLCAGVRVIYTNSLKRKHIFMCVFFISSIYVVYIAVTPAHPHIFKTQYFLVAEMCYFHKYSLNIQTLSAHFVCGFCDGNPHITDIPRHIRHIPIQVSAKYTVLTCFRFALPLYIRLACWSRSACLTLSSSMSHLN